MSAGQACTMTPSHRPTDAPQIHDLRVMDPRVDPWHGVPQTCALCQLRGHSAQDVKGKGLHLSYLNWRNSMTQQSNITLALIQQRRQTARKLSSFERRSSKLERYRHEIMTLHNNGASLGDIQFFLKTLASPPVDVARSTIKRFLDRPVVEL